MSKMERVFTGALIGGCTIFIALLISAALWSGTGRDVSTQSSEEAQSPEGSVATAPFKPIAFEVSGDIRQVDCDLLGTEAITYAQAFVSKITVRTDQSDQGVVTISGTATYGDGTTETFSAPSVNGVVFLRSDLETLSVVATGTNPSNVATLNCTATAVVQASIPPGLGEPSSPSEPSLVNGTEKRIAKYLNSNFDGTYWLPWIDYISLYESGPVRNLEITLNGLLDSDQASAKRIAQIACIAIFQWWIDEVRSGNQAFDVLFVGSSQGNVYRREDFARGENCLGD